VSSRAGENKIPSISDTAYRPWDLVGICYSSMIEQLKEMKYIIFEVAWKWPYHDNTKMER
jgi:hypothetical protein